VLSTAPGIGSFPRSSAFFRLPFLVGCVLLLALCACAPANCTEAQDINSCARILFIGNSYTYVNDLPGTFAQLAASGGHRVETGMVAPGGWTLQQHAASTDTINAISASKWNYVILQEQSQIPADAASRAASMYPAARSLASKIEASGAKPMFYLTPARREGWPEDGMPDYPSMQFQIDIGYIGISQELGAPVAPVGYAWLLAVGQNPRLDLWQADGSHPSETGTYLAACVFYATIYRQSPAGLSYTAGLPQDTVLFLQQMAGEAVLNNPSQWNLP
jgi:hypothetical protein